jgi:N-acyl-D-aspartate/D-glutamate deacylase
VNAGQQTIEHVVSLFEGPLTKLVRETGLRQEAAMGRFTDEYFTRLSDRMVAQHTWFDPTLIAYWTRSNQWDLAADPRNRYVAASGREFWKVFADLPNTPEMRALQARAYARFVDIVRLAASRGVRIVSGTDLATKFLAPGFSLHDELKRLVDAGLTPVQAIRAATRNSAEAVGALKDAGTIEAGKRADLALLDADPIAAIANTSKISAVVVNGRILDRAALDRLLANAEAEAPRR